ncbi:acyl-CoA N-acyltransferase [Coemansia spiralis]|nr:acyl-CoA N-acyltransferase [Coemansia spiralis]
MPSIFWFFENPKASHFILLLARISDNGPRMTVAATDSYPIQVATKEQLKEALSIRVSVFVNIQKFPLEKEVDEYDSNALHMVMLEPVLDDRVVGTLRIINEGEVVRIGRIVLLPEYQFKGLGTKLLLHAEAHIANSPVYNQGLVTKLLSQCEKQAFYEKCGYKAIGDVFQYCGVLHTWMCKEINRKEPPKRLL